MEKERFERINKNIRRVYYLMVLNFLLLLLYFSVAVYFDIMFMILSMFIPLLWLFCFIFSLQLLIKPDFRLHGGIMFGLCILFFIVGVGFYLYLSSPAGPQGPRPKVINIQDSQCKDGRITITLLNDGAVDIYNSELKVWVDGTDKSTQFNFSPDPIPPRGTAMATSLDTYEMNKFYQIRVVSPSNAFGSTVSC
jgi:hypothetical protein